MARAPKPQLLDAATQTGDHARASRIAPLAALLPYSASAQTAIRVIARGGGPDPHARPQLRL